MAQRILLIIIAFVVGEALTLLLVRQIYRRLTRSGELDQQPRLRQGLLLGSLMLPAAYAVIALVGVIVLVQAFPLNPAVGQIPLTGGSPANPGEDTTALPPTALITQTQTQPLDPDQPPEETQPVEDPADAQPTPTIVGPTSQPPNPGTAPGGQIVYVCQIYETGDRDQICLVNPDGSGYRRLTTNDQADYNFPEFSPDGRSIIYVGKESYDPDENFEIFEQDLADGSRIKLTDQDGNNSAPAISPDGSRIVFNRIVDAANTIWVMDRDGNNPRQVFGPPQGSGWDPTWSPDGQIILFASDRSGTIQLYVMNPDGSGVKQVTDYAGLRGRTDWSPDGATIATYAGDAWQREIVLFNADGSNPRLLTGGGNNLAPSFSPDGEWLVFTSYRDLYGNDLGCEIYMMRLDGTEVTRLTHNTICDWQPRWGP